MASDCSRTVRALKKVARRKDEPGVKDFFVACNSVLRHVSFRSMPFLNPTVKKTLEIQDTIPCLNIIRLVEIASR